MTCNEMARSQDYFDIISTNKPDFLSALTEGEDYCELRIDDGIMIYYVPKDKIRGYSLQNYGYQLIPKIYGTQAFEDFENQLAIAFEQSGIEQVKSQPLNLTGLNTLIGVIDSGLRFSLSPFLDELGLTRVVSLWDQSEEDGTPPEGFLIGKQYEREELQSIIDSGEDTRRFDEDGHGTAVTSVMAKASPLAEFAIVKCRQAKRNLLEYYGVSEEKKAYSEVELLQAVKYLTGIAKREKKPMVICIGLGTNFGAHGSEGILQQYLEESGMRSQITIVVPSGNENASAHHCRAVQEVEIRVGEGRGNFMLECWSDITTRYLLNIRTPGGEVLSGIDARNGRTATYEFVFDQTKLFISTALVERGSGRSLIIIRFQNPTAGIWNLQFTETGGNLGNNNLDLWLPIDGFLSRTCIFLVPSIETTVTEPSTARRMITVGAYSDGNGSIAPFSGRGPTVGGKILPDICAPGVDVDTVLGIYSGTGIAAAITCGAVSLFLEWAVDRGNIPYISSEAIRNLLILGATRESGTVYPNNTWGYGKLNLTGVFERIAGLI